MARKASIKVTQVKKGRRLYGGIFTLSDGRRVYLAYRKIGEIFRSGEKTISDAIRARTACWAIDEETLIQMRAQGIRFVGVLCRDNGDVWLTTIDCFFDRKRASIFNYERRGGALQRYLPLQHFRRRPGRVRV